MPQLTQVLNTAVVVAFLIQTGLPLLVGLVTKKTGTSPKVKAVLLLILSALNNFLVTWLAAINNHEHWDWKTFVFNLVFGFVISVGVHYGFWKPTGAADVAQRSLVKDTHTLAA